eukprot:4653472-Amphidinium_carterae.1
MRHVWPNLAQGKGALSRSRTGYQPNSQCRPLPRLMAAAADKDSVFARGKPQTEGENQMSKGHTDLSFTMTIISKALLHPRAPRKKPIFLSLLEPSIAGIKRSVWHRGKQETLTNDPGLSPRKTSWSGEGRVIVQESSLMTRPHLGQTWIPPQLTTSAGTERRNRGMVVEVDFFED